jgi:hypothetical protein
MKGCTRLDHIGLFIVLYPSIEKANSYSERYFSSSIVDIHYNYPHLSNSNSIFNRWYGGVGGVGFI